MYGVGYRVTLQTVAIPIPGSGIGIGNRPVVQTATADWFFRIIGTQVRIRNNFYEGYLLIQQFPGGTVFSQPQGAFNRQFYSSFTISTGLTH